MGCPLRPSPATPSISAGPWLTSARQDQEAQFHAFLDDLDLLKVRLDRLFRKSEDDHSLHISLGCIQESLKIITLRARLRHLLEGRP